MKVFDISDAQTADRASLLINSYGAEGLVLKLGESLSKVPTLDDNFQAFLADAQAAGTPFGIYYVSHAENMDEFMVEANWINDQVAELLGGQEPELGTWWDMEVNAVLRDDVWPQLRDAIGTMQTWWTSNKIGIYAGYSYFKQYLPEEELKEYNIPIWVAQYCYSENSLKAEWPELNHVAWQWTAHGENPGEESLDGAGMRQDENVWYGFQS